MRVNITLTDHETASLLAQVAENEGMTVDEWVNDAFDRMRLPLREVVKDVKSTGASVRLAARLAFD